MGGFLKQPAGLRLCRGRYRKSTIISAFRERRESRPDGKNVIAHKSPGRFIGGLERV